MLATSTISVLTSINGGPFAASNNIVAGDVVRAAWCARSTFPAAVGLRGRNVQRHRFELQQQQHSRGLERLSPLVRPARPRRPRSGDGNRRIAPFAASASTAVPTHTLAARTLTIGGSGTGGRIPVGQNAPSLAGTRFNPANPVGVFQFSFTVGNDYNLGDVIPINVVNLLNPTVNGLRWYNNLSGTTAISDPNPIFREGTLTYVPAPGALAVVGLGGLMGARRPQGRGKVGHRAGCRVSPTQSPQLHPTLPSPTPPHPHPRFGGRTSSDATEQQATRPARRRFRGLDKSIRWLDKSIRWPDESIKRLSKSIRWLGKSNKGLHNRCAWPTGPAGTQRSIFNGPIRLFATQPVLYMAR